MKIGRLSDELLNADPFVALKGNELSPSNGISGKTGVKTCPVCDSLDWLEDEQGGLFGERVGVGFSSVREGVRGGVRGDVRGDVRGGVPGGVPGGDGRGVPSDANIS